MKKLLALLLLCGIGALGTGLYRYASFAELEMNLEKETAAIFESYRALAMETVMPLAEEPSAIDAQRATVDRIAAIHPGNTPAETVAAISALQMTLTSFVNAGGTFSTDPRFVRLKEEMGERGSIRKQLNAYNTTVLRWNRAANSFAASLLMRDTEPLPSLRFDGEKEFIPSVSL